MTDFETLVHQIAPHGRLLRAWPLTGGLTAEVTALEVQRSDGQTVKYIVRKGGDPLTPREEYRLIRHLHAHGLPVPNAHFADDVCVVLDFIEGQTEFAPAYVPQMAAVLADIHRVEIDLPFLPNQSAYVTERLTDTPQSAYEARIRDALMAVWPLTPLNHPALLHGDYWPGNLLWREGRLAAVIDWEDAAVGDPLADVAICRLELLWEIGAEASRQFTETYAASTPHLRWDHLPYWDLFSALRPINDLANWGLAPDRLARMESQLRQFAQAALDRLQE